MEARKGRPYAGRATRTELHPVAGPARYTAAEERIGRSRVSRRRRGGIISTPDSSRQTQDTDQHAAAQRISQQRVRIVMLEGISH
jgi:hypothetical protein